MHTVFQNDWQPEQWIDLAEFMPSSSVSPGTLMVYDVFTALPYRTAARLFVESISTTPPLMVSTAATQV